MRTGFEELEAWLAFKTTGLVVIDEIQRRPDLFPVSRALAARF